MAGPAFTEIAPYPKGKFVNGDFIGERLLECDHADVASLLEWFDAYPNDVWPYPFGGWSQTALCTAAHVMPKPGIRSIASTAPPLQNYAKAWIYLTYSTNQMMSVGGLHVWEGFYPGLHQVCLPRPVGLLWASDEMPILPGEARFDVFMPHGEYVIKNYKLATAPSNMPLLWGKVNATSYATATLGYWFGADTMLCAGATVLRGSPGAVTHNWKQAWYLFKINLAGWSKVWRSDIWDSTNGHYESVLMPDGSPYEYPSESFQWTDLRV